MVTRDTLGFAVKATAAWFDDPKNGSTLVELYKDPKTGDGVKKSARGLLQVVKEDGKLTLKQQVSAQDAMQGELKLVFRNGYIPLAYTWDQIRKNYQNS
jgi:nicotinamide phosphoribosyltransferase